MSERLQTFAVFAAHILSELYDQFPLLVDLNKQAAIQAVFDFETLTSTKRALLNRQNYRELVSDLLQSNNPHLTETQCREFEQLLCNEKNIRKDNELQQRIAELENTAKQLTDVLDGTITFLEAEDYIRNHKGKWQLTEKGFAHLNKKFTDATITDAKETLISKIKEQLSNPSKIGAQSLLQILGGLVGSML